jgi:hypothetical protein
MHCLDLPAATLALNGGDLDHLHQDAHGVDVDVDKRVSEFRRRGRVDSLGCGTWQRVGQQLTDHEWSP